MASWGHCLEPLKKLESHILMELKTPCEDTWKMGEFMAFSQHFVIQVMPELHTLIKVMPKAHPKLQTMLIDIQQYKPTWIVGGRFAIPWELDFTSSATGKWEDKLDELVDLDAMHYAKTTLGKVSLPPKACFVLGKAKLCICSLTVDPRKGIPWVAS